ncbi:MAG: hypothetical protein WCL00_00185 [Bacteroidota bacterium]
MKKKFNVGNLFFNVVVALMLGAFFAIPPLVAMGASVIAGTLLSFAPHGSGILMAGLQKEIWTDILLEKFYPENSFISEARDMSSLVEYNKINLAEVGASPDVLIDNTSYPIAVSSRTDVPKDLALKTLDTTSTVVRNVEAMELMYDKMASVIYGHKQELLKTVCKLAAWNYAPTSDAVNTPVIAASGYNVNGRLQLTFNDVLSLMTKFNLLDFPADGRILVLNPMHEADLIAEDLKMYKAVLTSGNLFGFKLFRTSVTPVYNADTLAKAAYGAVAAATDCISSFAFHKDEVMKAIGTTEMFAKYADPDNKGDVINFQMRFCALPLRTKAIAAIYSPLN